VVEIASAAAIVLVRRVDTWPSEIVAGDAAHLPMPRIGIEVRLAELHVEVDLVADETAEPTD
jgi:hypothetical protein